MIIIIEAAVRGRLLRASWRDEDYHIIELWQLLLFPALRGAMTTSGPTVYPVLGARCLTTVLLHENPVT